MKLSKRAIEHTAVIVSEVMKKYENDLWKTVYVDRDPETGTPMIEMFQEGLKVATTQEEKDYFTNAINSGIFNKTEEIIVPEIAKKIDDEINERILADVEKGLLPKLSAQILKKKTRKYVRKNKANSKEISRA